MARTTGTVNRKTGIYGQSTEKIRDENNNIDRNRINVVIEYNDTHGNRYKQVFEARMKKDGSGVYITQGASGNSKPELISENTGERVKELTEEQRIAREEGMRIRKERKAREKAERAKRIEIRAELGIGTKGSIPLELESEYNRRYNEWANKVEDTNPSHSFPVGDE